MDAFEVLKPAIISHIGALRLNALLFLASKAVERDEVQNSALQACIQAEQVEISGSRTPERTLKTTRLGPLAPVGQTPGSLELCIRWLVGTYRAGIKTSDLCLTPFDSTTQGQSSAVMEGYHRGSYRPNWSLWRRPMANCSV
jgi:hypothetical protein